MNLQVAGVQFTDINQKAGVGGWRGWGARGGGEWGVADLATKLQFGKNSILEMGQTTT